MENKLIAFFSRAGENYYGGSMRRVEIGNTKILAQTLKELGQIYLKLNRPTPIQTNI